MDYLQFLISGKERKPRQRAERISREGNRVIFNQLCSEWVSRFSWTCDNDELPAHLIEPYLLMSGMLGFTKYNTLENKLDPEGIPAFMKARSISEKNIYNEPTAVMLTTMNGHHTFTGIPYMYGTTNAAANTVLLYDNYMSDWPLQIIDYYTTQLGIISQRVHAAITNILPTIVVSADESEVGHIKKAIEAADRGVPIVLTSGNKMLDQGDLKLLATKGADDCLKTLLEGYDKLHALFLQNIGLSANTLMNKLSGVSPIEIARTSAPSSIMLDQDLAVRKQCAENINALLGIKLTVKCNVEDEPVEDSEAYKGGKPDGIQDRHTDDI